MRAVAGYYRRADGRAERPGHTIPMLRVVERLSGEGQLWRGDEHVLDAGYQLAVYREWKDAAGELVAEGYVIDGHLLVAPDQLESLVFTATPLVLRLDDGRRVAIYVVSDAGAIAGADDRGIEGARE